jgi:flagellar basal body rod protein FlgB
MLRELFGPTSLSTMLRGGLEEASATHRAIAERVANALPASSTVDFSAELKASTERAQQTQADLERDMTELADIQLRYEADAKLLQAAYSRLHTAVRERG